MIECHFDSYKTIKYRYLEYKSKVICYYVVRDMSRLQSRLLSPA
jgi:hypothetical protein